MRIIFTFIICLGFILSANAQRCTTPQYNQRNISAFATTGAVPNTETISRDTLPNEVIVIPVVIHVLYNTDAENISDQQVFLN